MMRAPDGRLTPKEIKDLWECHSRADRERFKQWILKEVAALKRERIEDADPADEPGELYSDPSFNSEEVKRALDDPQHKAAMTKLGQEYLKRAIRSGDNQDLQAGLARHPELVPFAVGELTRKRGRGREKGDPRPGDRSAALEWRLQEADVEVELIKSVVRRRLGKVYWAGAYTPPSAIQIAAEHRDVTEEELINYRKNKRRKIKR